MNEQNAAPWFFLTQKQLFLTHQYHGH